MFAVLLLGVMLLGFLEVMGIASVLPFMELMSKPDAIEQSSWLTLAYETFGFDSQRSFLIAAGCFVIALIATANILGIITTFFQLRISWGIAHRLSTQLLAIYGKKPYAYFLRNNTSDLRAYLIAEVAALTSGVLIPLVEFLSRSIIVTIIFGVLMLVSPGITLSMAAFLGGTYFLIYKSRQRFLKRMGNERVTANSQRFRYLEEMLTGIKTVRIFGATNHFYNRYEQASKEFNTIQPRVQMVYATPRYFLEIIAFGGILGVTMYLYISTGELAKVLPRLSFFAIAGYRLLPALQRAFAAAAKVRHNLPSLDKLYSDLLEAKKLRPEPEPEVVALPFTKKLSLQNLSFRYENAEATVINDLNLEIGKGDVVAFVGSTGSGKTTLIDLITGLLTPTGGRMVVDSATVSQDNVERWQKNIAYVPQEVFLYDDSIEANIAIGQLPNEVDHKRLAEAMKLADIYNFVINELPNGTQTQIGERGVRLSGGQRQRLGLARALYANPSVLVLDEATSALDSITEKGIIESLQSLPDELTIIIIAHRLSTVRYADNIFLLDGGKIVANGLYEQLIQSNNKFKEMDALS